MPPRSKPSFVNPFLYRDITSDEGRFRLRMNEILDATQRVKYDQSQPNGEYFEGIVISGFNSGIGNGTGFGPLDSSFETDEYGRVYLSVSIYPVGHPISRAYADPRTATDAKSLVSRLNSISRAFRGITEYPVANNEMDLQFGQKIKCKFIGPPEDFNFLVIEKPMAPSIIDPGMIKTYGIEIPRGVVDAFDSRTTSFVGDFKPSSNTIDPNFPPRKKQYIGQVAAFRNQFVQNGNYPPELLAQATKGSKNKPILIKDIVPSYDKMCVFFNQSFPAYELGGSGYRTYESQLNIYKDPLKVNKKGQRLGAKPGTSRHGYGLAVDLHYFIHGVRARQSVAGNPKVYGWLYQHSHKYGFKNPSWARPKTLGGTARKIEPWHYEWIEGNKILKGFPRVK